MSRTILSGCEQRLPSLDGLRAIAVLMVIGSHAPYAGNFPQVLAPYWRYLFKGDVGVRIFFVLSGYLITHLLIAEERKNGNINLLKFFARRSVRILPVFLAYLLVVLMLDYVTALEVLGSAYLVSLTFTRNMFEGGFIDGHLWSLSVEEQFYVVWPFVFARYRRVRIPICLTAMLIAPVCRVLGYVNASSFMGNALWMHMDQLMIGCLAAILHAKNEHGFRTLMATYSPLIRSVSIVMVYAVWCCSINGLFGPLTVPFGRTMESLAIAAILISVVEQRSGVLFDILNSPILIPVGLTSYSIYIWQQIFMSPPGLYFDGMALVQRLPWNLMAVSIAGILSYRFIEVPFIKIRHRFRSAQSPASLPTSPCASSRAA